MFSVSRDPVSDDAHTYNWFTVPRGGFDALENYITRAHWSGVLWQPGVRRKENFYCAQYAVFDFDEKVTKEQARRMFAPFVHLMGATHHDGIEKPSKTPDSPPRPACDRFRVVVPFMWPIFNVDVYQYNMRLLIARFGADPMGAGAHMKWKPCREVFARQDHGQTLDVVTDIPEEETDAHRVKVRKEHLAKYKEDGVVVALPVRVLKCLQGKVAPGRRNPELFACCATMFDLGYSFEQVRVLVERIPWFHECSGPDTLQSAARKVGAAL